MNPPERLDRAPAASGSLNQDIHPPNPHWLHGAHGPPKPGISRDLTRLAPASSPSPWNHIAVDGEPLRGAPPVYHQVVGSCVLINGKSIR